MDAIAEWEQRTGKSFAEDLHIEYAVPCLDRPECRANYGTDRAAAEAHAQTEGSVIELRVTTYWRPA